MVEPFEHVLDTVDDLLHGVLGPVEARQVEAHCESCPICKVALEEARKRFAAVTALPPCEASSELIDRTLDRVSAYERSWRRSRKIVLAGAAGAAAAAVLVLASLQWYYRNLSPTPLNIVLLTQGQLLAGTTGSLRVRLVDGPSGVALAGIPVDLELRPRTGEAPLQLTSFTTDADGTAQPRFQIPDWPDGDYDLRVIAHPATGTEMLAERVALKRSWKLMLTSDKPVYQPGQTIHIRSLTLRRPDRKPVAGQEITFSITDPRNNIIFKEKEPTSAFGIAAINCPLAVEILEGTYTIAAKIGDTESKLAIEVKHYVLPKFKIDIHLDRPFYQPGQRVQCTIDAAYFFGKPVAGGTVEMEIRSTDIGPRVERKLSEPLDAMGKGVVTFDLPVSLVGVEQHSGDAHVEIQATVTDRAGQKESRTITATVTNQPLRIEVIPEAGKLVHGLANTIYLYASYADGRPAAARLPISGLSKELITSDLGVAAFELTPATDQVTLTIRATDREGLRGKREVTLGCGAADGDFLVRTDKAVYNGGDTVRLVALGQGREPVFVDLLKDGQTILTETIDLKDGRGELPFDLPPDLSGTLQLCAYRLGTAGVAIRKTRVLSVRPAQELAVKVKLDRAEYRPGGRAKLELTLTGNNGKPTPGALSLAAVDEAVYSVLAEHPGTEQAFFTVEQELLKPMYEICPWFDVLSAKNEHDNRADLEKALFSIPASSNGLDSQTLSVNSFAEKVRATEETKNVRLAAVQTAWTSLAMLVGIVAVMAFLRAFVVGMVSRFGCGNALVVVVILGVLTLLVISSFMSVSRSPPGRAMMAPPAPEDERVSVELAAPAAENPSAPAPRVRQWFPETLLWRPELITDDRGVANLDFDLGDSITTWRLLTSAVTADGRLGAAQTSIRVFQPFFIDLNLPVRLTRGDEISIPVIAYNYLDKRQTVELTLADAPWFERLEKPAKSLKLAAREVQSTSYRVRVTKAGNHQLQVTARGAGVADAIKRPIEVVPDGRPVEKVFNGNLQGPVDITLSVPDQAIEDSTRVILKIYPSTFSQLVEGLDAIFRLPYGCFEQTSSTTYPNVLALDYLRQTNQRSAAVEAKARQYIHLGYQRLLGFEVAGGGFDWFGQAPANRALTAYGLLEFQDMARVHDVDPRLIERTRNWLLAQRNGDGSWSPESRALHDDPAHGFRGGDRARLSTTAYIAWAVFGGNPSSEADRTRAYLRSHDPQTLDDPYVLALIANALLAIEPGTGEARRYLDRLLALKHSTGDRKHVWWDQRPGDWTTFYGAGKSGSVETTALAMLALVGAGGYPEPARGALSWLMDQRDGSGTWYSTQATVLALKALLAGTGKTLGGDKERRIEIARRDGQMQVVTIPAGQAEVVRQLDLTEWLGRGSNRVHLAQTAGEGAGYQLTLRYHVPGPLPAAPAEPLAIELTYDRVSLSVNDTVTATATITNRLAVPAPMIVLDLPVPAGFTLDTNDLSGLVSSGAIARYQITPRSAIVYLRGLEPGKPLQLRYRLRASMPLRITAPAARAYQYYDPDKNGSSRTTPFTVTGK
jgi:hypothetical protein